MPTLNINAALSAGNTIMVGEVQSNRATATLAVTTTASGRPAKSFHFVRSMIDSTGLDGPARQALLAYLIASEAANTCSQKFMTGTVIQKIVDDVPLLLDEIFGLLPCPPPHRCDNGQFAELVEQIKVARAANGLERLPVLKPH